MYLPVSERAEPRDATPVVMTCLCLLRPMSAARPEDERLGVVSVTAQHSAKAVQAGEICTLQTLAAVSLALPPGSPASQGSARR